MAVGGDLERRENEVKATSAKRAPPVGRLLATAELHALPAQHALQW